MLQSRIRRLLPRFGRPPEPTSLHITHPKSGSQWVYAVLEGVFGSRVVRPRLAVAHVLRGNLERGRIYPCAYLARRQFEALSLPEGATHFVVIRDLRDTLVSLYFSQRYSHPILNDALDRRRTVLGSMELRDGLRFLIERDLERLAEIQRSWIQETERVFRYEELLDDELGTFRRMFRAAGLAVPDDRLERAVRAHSFAARSGRRPGEEDVRSHFRKGVAGDWRHYLDGDLKDLFKRRYADLLIATGYEQDSDW